MDMTARKKKVLCPIETGGENGKPSKTYWMRVGVAFLNKDGSTNIYLDAMPKNGKLQVRDYDERDLAPRSSSTTASSSYDDGERAGLAAQDRIPF